MWGRHLSFKLSVNRKSLKFDTKIYLAGHLGCKSKSLYTPWNQGVLVGFFSNKTPPRLFSDVRFFDNRTILCC